METKNKHEPWIAPVLIILMIGLAVFVVTLIMPSPEKPQAAAPEPTQHPVVDVVTPSAPPALPPLVAVPTPPKTDAPKPEPIVKETMESRLRIPAVAQLRYEIRADPHNVPESLMEFAQRLTQAMDEAKNSLHQAKELFQTLTKCTKTGPTFTIRFLCLDNAYQLSEFYVQKKDSEIFVKQYDTLEKEAPPELVEYLYMMEEL